MRHPIRLSVLLTLGTLLGLTAGCATTPEDPNQPPFAELILNNDSPTQMTAFAIRGGARLRLGMINGLSSQRFRIRPSMLESGQLQVMLDPLGSTNRYYSDPIFVNEGDVIELSVSGMAR